MAGPKVSFYSEVSLYIKWGGGRDGWDKKWDAKPPSTGASIQPPPLAATDRFRPTMLPLSQPTFRGQLFLAYIVCRFVARKTPQQWCFRSFQRTIAACSSRITVSLEPVFQKACSFPRLLFHCQNLEFRSCRYSYKKGYKIISHDQNHSVADQTQRKQKLIIGLLTLFLHNRWLVIIWMADMHMTSQTW